MKHGLGFGWLLAAMTLGCASGPGGRLADAGDEPAGGSGGTTAVDAGGGRGGSDGAVAEADASGGSAGTSGTPDAGAPDSLAGAPDSLAGAPDGPTTSATNQGPVAQGRIVFSQDFETGMDGITRSPTNLPPERAQIADDPLGQRGKVMKIVWQAGDKFQTNGGSTHTRSWISNTSYSFPVGSTVHYAWGYMSANREINAAFAQVIRPGGPMWLIEGTGDGQSYVNCRSCGGQTNLPVKIEPNRWYDLRVEMTYANGGPILFFIDGTKVLERKMTVNDPAGQKAHWDGGIYNHGDGTTTRTVYISNLSVGLK